MNVKTLVDSSFAVDCRLGNITVNPGKNEPVFFENRSRLLPDFVFSQTTITRICFLKGKVKSFGLENAFDAFRTAVY